MKRALAALAAFAALIVAAAEAQRPQPVNMAALAATAAAPTLDAYRLFTDAGARTPNAGVTPYVINTELYSDAALKFRFVFVPNGQRARYNAQGVLDFPVGTVLVKTFAVAPDMQHAPAENIRYLETRLLIRQQSGWVARAYVWNEAQTEARLTIAGAAIPVSYVDPHGEAASIEWRVPNRNQCGGCHEIGGAMTPLGPSARNLNRDGQLTALVNAGVLDAAPADAPRAPRAFDASTGSLDQRARAYLDVNCAHCHNPDGPAHTSGLDLRAATSDPVHWGVRKRPVAAGRGSAGFEFSIAPGAPERSILVYRMESLDPGVMMPELGRQRIDREGVALIREWIAAMDETGRPRQTAP